MERTDIDRWVAAQFSYQEARQAALYGNRTRLTETSICLANIEQLRAVSEAVGVLPTVKTMDASGNPIDRQVIYNGCSFWCREHDPIPGGA